MEFERNQNWQTKEVQRAISDIEEEVEEMKRKFCEEVDKLEGISRRDIRLFNVPQSPEESNEARGERSAGSLLVACLTSQQHATVSQGRICSDNFTCCHTEIEVADQTFYLTQSHYTDTGPTSPSADPIMPGAWKGSDWSANV